MDSQTSLVAIEFTGDVAVATLNRPEKLNTMTDRMFVELHEALSTVATAPRCKVVVLAGAGRSFTVGLDLKSDFGGVGPGRVQGTYAAMRRATAVVLMLREMPQPIIAATQCHAVGAGFALAAASGMRIASTDAQFNAVFTKIGMTPGDLGLSCVLAADHWTYGRSGTVLYRERTRRGRSQVDGICQSRGRGPVERGA